MQVNETFFSKLVYLLIPIFNHKEITPYKIEIQELRRAIKEEFCLSILKITRCQPKKIARYIFVVDCI